MLLDFREIQPRTAAFVSIRVVNGQIKDVRITTGSFVREGTVNKVTFESVTMLDISTLKLKSNFSI